MAEGGAVWLYAVMGPGQGTPEGVHGVAGETIRPIEGAGLTAVVGSVPASEYGDAALRRHLEDLTWLEATARAHDRVVSALMRHGPTVPLRLATVCLDDARVRAVLEERRADLGAALELVTGRTEWGVKAYADIDALTSTAVESAADGVAGSGTVWLARRRAQVSARDNVEHEVAAQADAIHTHLVRRSVAGRRQPPAAPILSGTKERVALNGTYLVDGDRADDFAETVRALGKTHPDLRLELTGPWPPYSFAGGQGQP
jgi:hypothetical protein